MRFAGVSHPGLIGTAPSAELLATWNKREGALIEAHINSVPPVAFGPLANGAYVGQDIPDDVLAKIYREGARTIPGREHGGNCDVSFFRLMNLDCLNCSNHLLLDQEPVKVRKLTAGCLRYSYSCDQGAHDVTSLFS